MGTEGRKLLWLGLKRLCGSFEASAMTCKRTVKLRSMPLRPAPCGVHTTQQMCLWPLLATASALQKLLTASARHRA